MFALSSLRLSRGLLNIAKYRFSNVETAANKLRTTV